MISGWPIPLLAWGWLAMSSPWWEDYQHRERFLCGNQGVLVVERNDAQASLISGGQRFTLFRLTNDQPGLHYGTEGMELSLWGDSLTLEQGRRTLICSRTDDA